MSPNENKRERGKLQGNDAEKTPDLETVREGTLQNIMQVPPK